MGRAQQIEHHADRALAELDLARKATSEAAAYAHLELSELHLRQMRVLSEAPQTHLRLVEPSCNAEGKARSIRMLPAANLDECEPLRGERR